MNIADLARYFSDVAADHKLLLLFFVVAVGSMIGAISIKGFSLGPAGVLFFALAVSAYDPRLTLPEELGVLGLVLFAYTIGIRSGPSFFHSLRTGGAILVVVVGAIAVVAVVVNYAGKALGLPDASLSGVFAGSLTNTPALAGAQQAWKSELPTVGYSITYLFGVLGMLFISLAGLSAKRARKPLVAQPEQPRKKALTTMTIRVDREDLPDLFRLEQQYGDVVFSRIMTGDSPGHPGVVSIAMDSTVPRRGDILTAVGDEESLSRLCGDIGHPSTVALTLDRSALDYRRIMVSNAERVGKPISDLRIDRQFGAVITRIRRGDVDFLAHGDFVLEPGDRIRVVAPRETLPDLAAFFGDSEQKLSSFSMIGLSLGLLIGTFLGLIQVPLPGGLSVSLGLAGGVLIVGLVLGNVQKSGPILWTIPHNSSLVLTQLGTVLFLAYAGSNSGEALLRALSTPIWWQLLLLGIVSTLLFGTLVFLGGKYVADFTGARLAGIIAASQTQPAVLAYANQRSENDPDVNLGYALVYPAAMIAKVIIGPMVGRF